MEETNKTITTWEVEGETLKEIITPTEIEPNIILHDIKKAQEEIAKIDLAIEQWEAKKAPLQLLVDKYNEINYGK
jgi:hypothetical protein